MKACACRSVRRVSDRQVRTGFALEDASKLAETVISTIQVTEGANAADVAASWSGSTAVVVANALKGLPSRAAGTGLRRL